MSGDFVHARGTTLASFIILVKPRVTLIYIQSTSQYLSFYLNLITFY